MFLLNWYQQLLDIRKEHFIDKVCDSCETLKEQLEYERANNKQLQDTLINILKPTIQEQIPVEIPNLVPQSSLFSKRRAALEQQAMRAASIASNSKILATADGESKDEAIEKLEQELGIKEG